MPAASTSRPLNTGRNWTEGAGGKRERGWRANRTANRRRGTPAGLGGQRPRGQPGGLRPHLPQSSCPIELLERLLVV